MKSYLIRLPDGAQMGPFPWEQMRKLYSSHRISENDLVWTEGMTSWLPLRDILEKESSSFSQQAAPPDPIPPKKEESYFLSSGGESRKGPYTLKEITAWYHTGQIPVTSFLWKDGMPEWVKVGDFISSHQEGSSFWGLIFGALAFLTGLSPIEKFSLKHIFKKTFLRRTEQERIDFFASGGLRSTPSLEEISTDWPAPWVFIRVLGLSLLMCIGFLILMAVFGDRAMNAVPGLLFAISFAVPFSVLTLFAEFNVRRNISWYSIIVMLLGGGTLSLIVTFMLNDLSNNPREAYWAGPIEETAKLAAAIFFARKFFLNGQILNGMLCGAAVGAGFAIFETAGYIINSEYISPGTNPLDIAVLRGILSPFAHIPWSAIMAGAFWLAIQKKRQNGTPAILQLSFWRIAVIPIGLHMFWNSPLLTKSDLQGLHKWGICAVICWGMIFLLVNEGLIQIRRAKKQKIDL
ncbi:GYF domain-containing protein [Akkermansia sp. N21116]|uniref:GYF domain-containing protein n=1 Tax=Akkermansia sp. N21116 TaxID=3040764 RepID=UPI002AC9CB00|nr:GYF domain-containing protein [Akkermansia sp. N21116]WPX40847.1 GYF domain-containing protein [Akkermansia sp. N21116]